MQYSLAIGIKYLSAFTGAFFIIVISVLLIAVVVMAAIWFWRKINEKSV